jgi:hypothetical protein
MGASAQNVSTRAGSNCVPERSRANGDGGVHPAGPVEHLHDVGQVDDARLHGDLLALGSVRNTLAVPPLERLLDAAPDLSAQPQLPGEPVRGQPVVLQHGLGVPAARADELHTNAQAFQQRLPRAHVPGHERHPGRLPREVRETGIGLQRELVAEPPGLLVGVDVAAHPGQQGHVIHDGALVLVEPQPLGHAQGDEAFPHHVLHGLAEPEVGSQGDGGQHLRQAHLRAGGRLDHMTSLCMGTRRDRNGTARIARTRC